MLVFNQHFITHKGKKEQRIEYVDDRGKTKTFAADEASEYVLVNTDISSFMRFYAEDISLIQEAHLLNYPGINDIIFNHLYETLRVNAQKYGDPKMRETFIE